MRMKEWMASDLSSLDLLVIQIDGIHMDEDLILVAAVGVDAKGDKHPLGLAEGATENAATVQALIDNLVERGLDPAVPRLFIIDGAKALSKAIRRISVRRRCGMRGVLPNGTKVPRTGHIDIRTTDRTWAQGPCLLRRNRDGTAQRRENIQPAMPRIHGCNRRHSGLARSTPAPGSDAIDPSATLAVHCDNGFDARFKHYQSTRLSRYNAGP
jgi:hypothetical protein